MFLHARKQGRRRGFPARLTGGRPGPPTPPPRKSRTQCDQRQRASPRRFGGELQHKIRGCSQTVTAAKILPLSRPTRVPNLTAIIKQLGELRKPPVAWGA